MQTMASANSGGVPTARTPRTVIRSHRAQLDQMMQMLEDAPIAASPESEPSMPADAPEILAAALSEAAAPISAADVEISYSGDSDSDNDATKTQEAIEMVYAEFSEDTKAGDDEVISILEAAVVNE